MISELKSKIKNLKKIDGGGFLREPQYKIFGSDNHRYKFNPTIDLEEVERFENKHQVQLPKEYKSFIMEIGNGGCGPAYGLFTLSQWNFDLDITEATFLSKGFPHTQAWNLKKNFLEEGEDYFDTPEFQSWENEYFSNDQVTGSMRICHYGCAIYYLLIVSGKERGNIWVDDRANDIGIYPSLSKQNKQRQNFFDWYDEWLTESLYELSRQKIS